MDARMRGEEVDGVVDAHHQDFADVLAPVLDGERIVVEAATAARIANDAHVRQEAHLYAALTLPLAAFAAPAGGIEGEARSGVAAHPRFGRLRENAADRIPETDVGRGTRARRLADRRLIDFQHAADLLPAADAATTLPARLRATAAAEYRVQVVVEDVTRQRRLARSRNTGHDDQPSERHPKRLLAQVVHGRALDRERGPTAIDRATLRDGMTQRLRQQATSDRLRRACQLLCSTGRDYVAAARTCARAEIDDMIGAPDSVLVVLDDEQRITFRRETAQRIEQDAVVARMQAD